MTIKDLLEKRHEIKLEWLEPWPACDPEGNDVSADVSMRATVYDCINLQRQSAKLQSRPTMGNDESFLSDFIAIHWACIVESK